MKKLLLSMLIFSSFHALAEWSHSVTEDKMGRGKDEVASVKSISEINLLPPYEGSQRATLSFRRMGKGSNELVLAIEKGQIVCDVSGCDVLIRRNEEKPFRITMEHPKDNSQNILIGRLSAREFGDLKSAEKITTELTIFQNGDSVLEFDTKNNPFKGMVVYTIDELKNKIESGDDINVVKTGELDIGEAGFAACRKILKSEKINPEEDIVQIIKDTKDLYVKVSYSESNKIFTTCKKGNKAMHLDVYQYQ